MQRVWTGAGILLATQAATAVITRQSASSETGVLAAAALTVLAILAIAALNLRHTPYPRWAYVSTVAIMGAAVLITPVTALSPESWARQTREGLWMFPWFLVLLSFMPAAKRGICAADSPYVGWLMVGTTVLLGVLLQLAAWLQIF